jgi:hypothetical protein
LYLGEGGLVGQVFVKIAKGYLISGLLVVLAAMFLDGIVSEVDEGIVVIVG